MVLSLDLIVIFAVTENLERCSNMVAIATYRTSMFLLYIGLRRKLILWIEIHFLVNLNHYVMRRNVSTSTFSSKICYYHLRRLEVGMSAVQHEWAC